MSDLTVHGMTLSVDFGDKLYGSGTGRFQSVSMKVPEGSSGVPITSDELIPEGLKMYFTAWQTLMQTRYASGEINLDQYKVQTAAFMVRLEKIQRMYQVIKGKTTQELESFLKQKAAENVSDKHSEQSQS